MDRIEKALQKLTDRERAEVAKLLSRLKSGKFQGLDVKKLKGNSDIYRIRKGKLRVIYRIDKNGVVFILVIERRNENTYKFTN